jgi:hypothetical protein
MRQVVAGAEATQTPPVRVSVVQVLAATVVTITRVQRAELMAQVLVVAAAEAVVALGEPVFRAAMVVTELSSCATARCQLRQRSRR